MPDEKPVQLQPGEGPIRCPAIRSLIKDGELKHENLKTAAVQDLVRVLSGADRDLTPDEPGSLANVAGFFAIHNHGVPEHPPRRIVGGLFQKSADIRDAARVAAGRSTTRLFSLLLFQSRGDHPGTVNFFKNDAEGEFQLEQFEEVMKQVSDGETITIGGIAKMIIMANEGRWDDKGRTLDLAKSAGEWALMVCVLRTSDATTDISVADLRQMYSQADPTKLLIGARRETAGEWLKVTRQISVAIAAEKKRGMVGIGRALHSAFKDINSESGPVLCPCMTCNPEV